MSRISVKKIFTIAIPIGIVIVLTISVAKAILLNNMIDDEIDSLATLSKNGAIQKFHQKDVEQLPEPVKRYFRYALPEGISSISFVSYQARGEFKLPFSDKYFNIASKEYISAEKKEMIFNATFSDCPFWPLRVHVRDKYARQKGGMCGYLMSVIKLFNENDKKELNQEMFLRYVGHLMMIPTALLPSADLRWEPIDPHTAKIVVSDGSHTGSAIVTFNDRGEIVKWETDGRYDRVDGQYRRIKLIANQSNYQSISGVRVPLDFKVEKILPDGSHEMFWKGRISDIHFKHL